MRILLTTSAAPNKSPFFCNEKRFPLGIGFLLSVLRNAGHQVYFIDNFLHPRRFWLEGFLESKQIDIVGIYSSTICYRSTKEIIEGCDKLRKEGKWNGKLILGGPHTSVTVFALPDCIDYIVKGEGEIAILDIVEGRERSRVIQGDQIANLDSLPIPAYDILYNHVPSYDTTVDCFSDNPVFTMNTSRGCPFSCKFCSVHGVWGRKYRQFSAGRIVEDIRNLMFDFNVKGIYFREDNFTANLNRVVQFCEMLLSHNIKIKWLCEARVSPLPKDIMSLMARAGCRWLYLGCESGSQRVLDLINKQIQVSDIRNVINWGKELGIKCYTSWIVGVPGETKKDRRLTDNLIRELKPFSSGMHVYIGLPGSTFYDEMIQTNDFIYKDDLGLIYSQEWNRLAVRINSYLLENKFCPVQSIPFKAYKFFRQNIVRFLRKHPNFYNKISESSILPIVEHFQENLLDLIKLR